MKTIHAACIQPAGAILGEGPVWHQNRLWWVDIERREIHSWDPNNQGARVWILPDRVGFAVPRAAGGFLVGLGPKIVAWEPEKGVLQSIVHPEADIPGNRFNDAKCDPQGNLWAGTMALSERTGCGSLYRINAQGWEATRRVAEVSISNGLAWSPDGLTMYYIDSPTRRVDAFDYRDGEIFNRRCVVELTDGFPDGMCSDADGNLWIALWGGWGVVCHDPRTGKRIAKIEVPVEAITSCCFGEQGGLFITTASRDLDGPGHLRQPLAGGIFYAETETLGVPVSSFAG